MPNTDPPKGFQKFFEWYCKPALQESILGDMEEQFYEEVETKGTNTARRRYVWNVIRFFRPSIVRKPEGTQKLNNYGMFKNYYKVSLRSILRNKTFSLLNVAGLGVGIASCLLILIYVKNELSYDTYNEKFDRIHRVLHYFGEKGEEIDGKVFPISEHQVWGNAPIADAMIEYFPQIESIGRFTSPMDWLVEYEDNRFQEKNIPFADSTLHQIFTWNWLAGNPATALTRPNTIVLSRKMAEKYFGAEDPIGKTLLMDGEDRYEVTAVYEIPPNSHFTFDGFISMTSFINRRPNIFDAWGYVDFYTYFTLHDDANAADLEEQVPAFLEKYYDSEYAYTFRFEPIADAYLNSEAGRQPGPVGNRSNIYLFISIAIFILVIACINFTNLATARSLERAKEVAIRKTIGSHRRALILQFLFEAVLLTCMAAVVAALLLSIGHGYLEILVDKPLPATWLFTPESMLTAIVALGLIGILAGSYPAFVLSNFKPVTVLRGSFRTSSEGAWLRKSLVVLQFALSIILLTGTVVISNQLNFLRQHDKGFDSNQVLVIQYGWDYRVQKSLDYIKSEFLKHPAVQKIGASRATPGDFFPNAGTTVEGPSGEMITKGPALYAIDEDFIPTYDMTIVAGRNYSRDFPLDSTHSMLFNEAAAKLFGYANPEDIVGKKFKQWGREGVVIGVVQDFNYVSLHKDVEPLALRYSTWYSTSMLSLKLNTTEYQRTLSELEDIWNQVAPHRPFVAHFSDTNFDEQYETDTRFGTVFTIFSGLAMFVACLGLLGLTIYSTAQRSKEIGVRKVLGASTQRIVALLSWDFIKLFSVSLVLSIPTSLFLMSRWLEGFAYRVEIGWEVFGFATAVTLIISLVTMSFKTISAALSNPAEILKDE